MCRCYGYNNFKSNMNDSACLWLQESFICEIGLRVFCLYTKRDIYSEAVQHARQNSILYMKHPHRCNTMCKNVYNHTNTFVIIYLATSFNPEWVIIRQLYKNMNVQECVVCGCKFWYTLQFHPISWQPLLVLCTAVGNFMLQILRVVMF